MNTEYWEGRRVLIVDDSKVIRASVRKLFTEAGFEVCGEVDNGVLALEFLQQNQVDLISLDVIMPEMNGIDCLRRIVKMELEVQTLFLSCLFDDQQVVSRLSAEFPNVAFLAKPLTTESLTWALERLEAFALPAMPKSA